MPLIGQTIDACRRILKSAELSAKDLSAVPMVEGTSRAPLVKEIVQRFSEDLPVYNFGTGSSHGRRKQRRRGCSSLVVYLPSSTECAGGKPGILSLCQDI